jgi:amino acid transporter
MAIRRAVGSLVRRDDLGEGIGYGLKRRLLGRPLINEQLGEQRLSKRLALGVLAPDGISSSAYGTEEILIELLRGGLAVTAFTLILPMTGVVLFVMALVVLAYREVVLVYTRAGGSYVVARENFGPRVAQVAAIALLIDYVVTVAVQVAAGTAAVASAIPALNDPELLTIVSICIVVLMCYGNLRGIREAGAVFAVPTYLFSGSVILMIITGLLREAFGDLPHYPYPLAGQYGTGHGNHVSLITFGMVFVLLRAFANGGSSLTGIEAVSNAVSAFQPPEGRNARRVLVIEGTILGTLVAGISWMAHLTHAAPFKTGVPTVIAQEAKIVFGHSVVGTALFVFVQAATALILYTGGNTSFNGFPFLASFVAEDAFLPRWLTKRGHRLVFSNGIIVLAVLSSLLLALAGSNVNSLVPFYAIGVFTAFTLAGFGMSRFFSRHRGPGWQYKRVITFAAGLTSMVVVLIFAWVKFLEGAWLVIVLFALGVPALIWLNRQYGLEASVLENIGSRPKSRPAEPPTYSRRTVFVFVDDFDLATIAALRYARSLRPTTMHAVHFVIDNVQADRLRQDWVRATTGIVLDFVDCPDRRLASAAAAMVSAEAALPGVGVTAILPRRSYAPLLGRLLHDRTADKMAGVISRIPHAAATIVPFDVRSRVEALAARQAGAASGPAAADGAPATGTPGPGRQEAAAAASGQRQSNFYETGRRVTGPAREGAAGSGPASTDQPGAGWAAAVQPGHGRPGPGPAGPGPAGPGQAGPGPAGPGQAGTGPSGPGPSGPGPAGPGPAGPGQAGPGPAGPGQAGTGPAGPGPGDPGQAGPGPAGPGQAGTGPAGPGPGDPGQAGTGEPGAGPAAAEAEAADAPLRESERAEASRPPGEPAILASDGSDYDRPVPPEGVSPIGSLSQPGRAVVEGRVHTVEIRPVEHNTVLACDIADSTGELTALFYGRSNIPGLRPGSKVRLRGPVGMKEGMPVMVNPAYELLAQSTSRPTGRPRSRRGRRDDRET